jgi:hypothetical protein
LSTSTAAKSVCQARGDAHHPCGAELGGELAGEVDHRRFGDVVDTQPELGAQPTDGGDVDDHTRPGVHRLVERGLGPEQRAAQVHLERLVVASLVDTEGGAEPWVRGGVVHQDVGPPKRSIVADTHTTSLHVAGVRHTPPWRSGADLCRNRLQRPSATPASPAAAAIAAVA